MGRCRLASPRGLTPRGTSILPQGPLVVRRHRFFDHTGIRLACLFLNLTGLDRFVAASYGAQQQVNRQIEEAIAAYRHTETARLAKDMPRKDITVTQDETF